MLAERCAPFLPTGADVSQTFIGQAAPNRAYFLITYLTGLTMHWIKYRCVAVTDDAVYVLESSKTSGGAKPTALIATLPRQTRLGQVSGRWAPVTLVDEPHWVHRRFHSAVMSADREAGFA